jgi:hypothetical protein
MVEELLAARGIIVEASGRSVRACGKRQPLLRGQPDGYVATGWPEGKSAAAGCTAPKCHGPRYGPKVCRLSPLEGGGSERSVPREIGHGFEPSPVPGRTAANRAALCVRAVRLGAGHILRWRRGFDRWLGQKAGRGRNADIRGGEDRRTQIPEERAGICHGDRLFPAISAVAKVAAIRLRRSRCGCSRGGCSSSGAARADAAIVLIERRLNRR